MLLIRLPAHGDETLERVWIRTGGRLHLGQLDLNGSLGRLYGGLGVAIAEPQFEVTAEKSESLSLHCPDCETERVWAIAIQYLKHYGFPGAKIELLDPLPSHSGLGSGTSLALALGFAITRVYGAQPSLTELAGITEREGSRSGIGVAAFEQGGFLIDGGRPGCDGAPRQRPSVPPLLLRVPFPEDWAILLAMPRSGKTFGAQEEHAFRSLPPMDAEVSGAICRLVLMKLLPGLVERDLQSFGQAVTGIQEYVGGYFAPVQGGPYASARAASIAEYMLSQGVVGVGQSSWGPTVYGFIQTGQQAELLEKLRNQVGDDGLVWATSGRNQGASWGWR
jgi:beta-RFAP synthase